MNATTSAYVLPLADPDATLERVGGKGESLAKLSRAGLSVPGGFHVTTTAYRQVVADNNLQPRILAALQNVDASQPTSLEAAAQTIIELFDRAHVSAAITAAVEQAYADLPGDRPSVAVRSSATAEDLPGLSFAGQQETYLNIRGAAEVEKAVRCCWASLWTPRAIGYRLRNGIDQGAVSLAVVVQLLVPADAAGILFTVNPVTGGRDQVMVSAAWGLGESVVGGTVTPDSVTVEKGTGRVLDRQTADKQVMTVQVVGGTEERPVPSKLRCAPVLSDAQAAELVRLGVRIEELYGTPMDVEWVLKDGAFSVVQARPITALPEEPAAPSAPVEWEVPDRGPYLHGGAFLEVLTEPVSTMFSTLGLESSDSAMREWLDRYGLGDMMVYPLGLTVNGYLYGRARYRPRPRHIPGYVGLIREHMRAFEVWQEEVERYREFAAELERVDLSTLSNEQLCSRIELINRKVIIYWLFVGEAIRPIISRENRFTKAYKKLAGDDDPEPQVLFRGGDTLALKAEKALYGLVEIAQEQPVVAAALVDAPLDALNRLEGDPVVADFMCVFDHYLNEYGYQMYSFDPLRPTLEEDPEPALLALQAYLRGQESPAERQKRMEQEREQALARLERRLSRRQYERLCHLMDEAREAARIREDAVFELGRAWRAMRHSVLELGRRLAVEGAIDDPAQVFWLRWDEILGAARALNAGERPTKLDDTAKRRHTEWQTWQGLEPPYVLPEGRKLPAWLRFVAPLPEMQKQREDVLTGFAASPGKVTGVARVIRSPAEMHRIAQGEILVVRTTTPAWTPIFVRTAALVTDLGGALSHSSIVAREYGIPAVTGTGFATQRIADGQVITVDGTNARVLLDGSAAE